MEKEGFSRQSIIMYRGMKKVLEAENYSGKL